jgi:hypothetical protein
MPNARGWLAPASSSWVRSRWRPTLARHLPVRLRFPNSVVRPTRECNRRWQLAISFASGKAHFANMRQAVSVVLSVLYSAMASAAFAWRAGSGHSGRLYPDNGAASPRADRALLHVSPRPSTQRQCAHDRVLQGHVPIAVPVCTGHASQGALHPRSGRH